MGNSGLLPIGVLAKQTGCKIPTIRYYESTGLLDSPIRTEGNQRRYTPDQIDNLRFILHARQLGFSIDSISELLKLSSHEMHGSHNADIIASHHLKQVTERIESLTALQKQLEIMLEKCDQGKSRNCQVIEALASSHTH